MKFMETIGGVLLLGGFVITVLSQTYIIISAFRVRLSAGLFCLLVSPIYAFISDLRKEININLALKIWVSGLIIAFVGVVVLSI